MTIISEIKNLYSDKTRADIIDFLDNGLPSIPPNSGDDGCNRYGYTDLEFFKEEHQRLVDLTSKVFEEPVVPTYTCLSCYSVNGEPGVLNLHLDRNTCRYTISYMIRCPEISSWPMYVSKYEISEEERVVLKNKGFPQYKKRVRELKESFEWVKIDHSPNSAAFFSGTHRWHYRDKIPAGSADVFMFHYEPLHPEDPRPETGKPPLV